MGLLLLVTGLKLQEILSFSMTTTKHSEIDYWLLVLSFLEYMHTGVRNECKLFVDPLETNILNIFDFMYYKVKHCGESRKLLTKKPRRTGKMS